MDYTRLAAITISSTLFTDIVRLPAIKKALKGNVLGSNCSGILILLVLLSKDR
jgi:hypothetical protein